MTLNYWWAHRNNRRSLRLPDLNKPFDAEDELPGTPASRFAACLGHMQRQLVIAQTRAFYKRRMRVEEE